MNLVEFLQELSIKGWHLWSEGERLGYDAPQEESTAPVLAQLKQHKAEILQLLDHSPDVFNVYPLSYGQQSLWFLWQLALNSYAYNVSFATRVLSQTNVIVWRQAFETLKERHPILRSTFPKQGKKPIQQVHQNQELDFLQIDAATWGEDKLYKRVLEAHQQPFDLEQGPVIRVRWFTRSEQEHIMLLTAHHITCDGCSIEIIAGELLKIYQAQQSGVEISLPVLQHSYQDYVHWQTKMLASPQGERLWSYWQQQLRGLPVLNLPTDRPRPPIQTYNGASHRFSLSEKLSVQLSELAQQEGATLYMTFLATLQILLYRYTGQENILVGSPTLGRTRPEFSSIVGYFVNPVVLRANVSENPSFQDFLGQVRYTVLEALDHQDYPFALLVERLQPNRDFSRSPIFQVLFVPYRFQQHQEVQELFISETKTRLNWGGLELEPFAIPQFEGQFDLTLEMAESSSSLVGSFKYNTDLFDEQTIVRMAGHFQTLLEGIVANPKQKVAQLPLLTPDERQQLLIEWNNTARDYPDAKCIHQLFEEQVERTPEALALVYGEQQLTYSQLNEQANQLAHYLRSLGIQPETCVGLCIERSVKLVVALLGILKAGGTYLPLATSYPQQHLAYMLSKSQATVLLTQSWLVDYLPPSDHVVCLDGEVFAQYSTENPISTVTPDNLAYVIYTSGSTGQPKGVAMHHRALVNLIHWQQQEAIVGQGARTLQFAPISFDVSFQEIFSTWCTGGTLVLITEEIRRDSFALMQFLVQAKIERLFAPFVVLQQLAAVAPQSTILPPLREIITAGEQLQITSALIELMRRLPSCRLQNQYGPSESHVVSAYTLHGAPASWSALPPIGRPLANNQLYILDRHLQPVPLGVPGELHIGGVALARGYLNYPELTAEKFVLHPFSEQPHTRLYKTGDLARYLPDGNIEFLGRLDEQVKVRGFRIELGELETVLSQHPQVIQASVAVQGETASEKRLIAYVVPSDKGKVSPEALRQYLQPKLPEYMIPSAFLVLEKLPVTANGKIDRQALPTPVGELTCEKEFIPARTTSEQTIAEIFAAVLKVPTVGIHNNFFELGGHSLLATQVIARLQEAFKVQIPLRTLFEFPIVTQLDQAIADLCQVESPQPKSDVTLPTVVPAPKERYQPFPLTEIQQAYWLGRNSAFELSNIASHIYIELDCQHLCLEDLNQAWQKVIDQHEMLRMVVLPDGQQQVLEQVPAYQIEVFDLCRHSPNSITSHLETIRQQMSHQVFATEKWPLFKLCATHLNEDHHRLHLSFDALIADAWSLMLIGQQWLQLYRHPQTLLPKVEASFRDYVLAELKLKDTPQYQRSQQYWWNRLSTLPPAPELPFAQQPTALKQPQFKRLSAKLTPTNWQQLKDKAQKINLTASSVLLAAFCDILTYWSKTPHFTINLTLFNRLPLHPQVNEIVGDFTSLTLLEVDNSPVSTFIERAQRLQGQLWQDLDHRYISGVAVQRELRRQRGSYQSMGVVFTSTLGVTSMAQQDWWVNQLGEMVYGITQTPQVWLDHQVIEEQGALMFNWDVVEELFPQGLLDDMFSSYCNYLQQLANFEGIWQATHPQLLPAKQLEIRQKVNQTSTAIVEQTLDSLFVQQVKQRGTSPAVITAELTLTYEQLYQRALELGHQLRQLSVTTNDRIAVVMSKGWEQVVAVLGILMSGAAYVPIDPELPQQRQWSLLAQAQVQLVVTQTSLHQHLSWPFGIECLCVDKNAQTAVQTPLRPLHHPSDLAYVIYTSGSTGVPKGVMIEHQGAVNTLIDINQRFGVTADDRVLALSALNFDLSVYDIFGILAVGGTIVMPTAVATKDPAHWLSLITAHQVTLWNSVPAMMQMLVEYSLAQPKLLNSSLRLALLSGDWLPLSLPEQIKAVWADVQVVSLGGATEASIWSICYPLKEVNSNWRSIPYGKPLGNQTFHVLNQLMAPTPVWVAGQLYIGGMGLAKGYWQDQQKTLDSFISHPLTQERLYKTGDLGRYLPDGNIEFLGREDFQVKINGYRIELGEIEAALMQHSLVKEAVVQAVGDSREKRLIVAYIVLQTRLYKLPEAYQPKETVGVILDPIERIEFKLKQPGLRQLSSTQPSVELPLVVEDEVLTQVYQERQSYRQFLPQPLSLQKLSEFLSCLRQLSLADVPLPKYRYPSAGNLYPVQTYLLIQQQRISGVEGGVYYYCPRQHRLVWLSSVSAVEGGVYGGNEPIFQQSAFSLFLIGNLDAIAPMYGELAERFCLLEAGHMGQLLMSTAGEWDIGLCPIGSLDFDRLRDLFALSENHLLLYSFVGGQIDSTQTQQWLTSPSSDPVSQLRQYLQQHLPEYMLPVEYVLLDSLPLSANGKVDRHALTIPTFTSSAEKRSFVAPNTPVEQELAHIWKTILEVNQVGIDDNFFEIGGNSLQATRLLLRIQQTFQVDLTLSNFFEEPTINGVAEFIEIANWVGQELHDSQTTTEEIEL